MKNILFICGKNKLRSPTAEAVFSSWPGIETDSAGVSADADVVVSQEQVLWADIICVMEKSHRSKLSSKLASALKGKKVICLDIPDTFDYMQPELVRLLESKMKPHIG